MKTTFSIVFIEDNPFYLKSFYKRIERQIAQMEHYWDCRFTTDAFTDSSRFLKRVNDGADLAFIDYNLGMGLTAPLLMAFMQTLDQVPRTVIFSENNITDEDMDGFAEHVEAILRKDDMIIPRSCVLIEQCLIQKHEYLNKDI